MAEPQRQNKEVIAVVLKRYFDLAGIDRAVLYGALIPVFGLISSPVTMVLIAGRFTPVVQGYYYTFGHVLLLQVFVELGLGQVVIQFASHEWSQLRLADGGRIEGTPRALSRLVSL